MVNNFWLNGTFRNDRMPKMEEVSSVIASNMNGKTRYFNSDIADIKSTLQTARIRNRYYYAFC